VLHARIGRDWIVPELGGQLEAMEKGNKAWSAALANSYDRFEREGLSNHENWWPEIYQDACRFWNITPDAAVLAYNSSYRNSRADRKELSE
jgi:hypothetical protein